MEKQLVGKVKKINTEKDQIASLILLLKGNLIVVICISENVEKEKKSNFLVDNHNKKKTDKCRSGDFCNSHIKKIIEVHELTATHNYNQ